MGGSRSDLRKSRVPGMIGRKEAVKNGVDCHSVNLTFLRGDSVRKRYVAENCVIMVCFTILAVVFCHWWIILFSALFINYNKN